ncbi:HAD family hydrolase [Paenibacillus sanguinis]|uniref:HAD family hydrolase n=1 Tax=Paenibacillus sanguinis TaxID=225906 RepID=UPI000381B507|nr:HAD-IA family hydrolase [Paenibacillus sanguinis]
MIRYVWFDLGYTLVKTNREEVYLQTLQGLGVTKTLNEITLAYHLADKLFMREFQGVLGKDSRSYMPWYIGVLNYYLQLSLPIEEVLEIHRTMLKERATGWRAFPYSKPTLRYLKELGYGIGLISNWNNTARDVLRRNQLDEELDVIVISSELELEKPDPAIFVHALQKAGVTAEESLYVGDNYYDDYIGSSQVGMSCLLINPYGKRGIEELSYGQVISGVHELPAYLGHPAKREELSESGVGGPSHVEN